MKFLFLGLLAFSLVAAGCINQPSQSPASSEEVRSQTIDPVVTLPVEPIEPVSDTVSNGEIDRFKEKFRLCERASVTLSLTSEIVYYYEIIGPAAGGCQVKSSFTRNPNPDWVGKEMVCTYDNSIDLDTAVEDTSRCSGELYDLINGG